MSVDSHKSTQTKTEKVVLATFEEKLDERLRSYVGHIKTMLTTQTNEAYAEYMVNPSKFGYPKGYTLKQFRTQYIHSTICLQRNETWCKQQSGAMSVTGLPGTAKTSIIIQKCTDYGLPVIHYTVAGLMGADIKGLPFIVRNEENIATGVEYEQGNRLPISRLSAELSGMSWEVFEAKKNLGMPALARYLTKGPFMYDEGIAPEFGVLLIDEFTTLDSHAQATLEKILSEPDNGVRGLAEGSYVFPPYWIIMCAMNLANEGGLGSGDEEGDADMAEFIRERISMHGFYTVFADASSREYLKKYENADPAITGFLDWSDRMRKKDNGRAKLLEGEDAGYLQFTNPGGGITSPRTWTKVLDRIADKKTLKAEEAFELSLSASDKEAYEAELEDAFDFSEDVGVDESTFRRGDFVVDKGDTTPEEEAEIQEVLARLDKASAIAKKRNDELSKHNESLTAAEYSSIIRGLIGIPIVATDFEVYYKVHQGIYSRFAKIEDKLKAYLRGELAQGPKLTEFGADVAKDAVAIGMSIKSYLRGACRDVFMETVDKVREIVGNPIKSEDKLHELAALSVVLYQLPLRVGRWLNDPKLFPVGIKDEVAAICMDVYDYVFDVDGVEAPRVKVGGDGKTRGRYPFCAMSVMTTLTKPVSSDLQALAQKGDACAKGAYQAIRGDTNSRARLCFAKVTKETNWGVVMLKKPVVLPSGKQWPIEVADPADLEYLDIVTSQGDANGNSVRDLFEN